MKQRVIFHVDVNSAFLSWEAVYRLKHLGGETDLREIVSAVGGDAAKRHGIILAKSLPAKAYGIKTGESLAEARLKCPKLLIVPPHYSLYEKCSAALMDILLSYTPEVEQYSIDEAYLDMSLTDKLWGPPAEAADRMRRQIFMQLGFTVNIGVSSNKLLAKMASDFKKPNRVHTLFPEEIPYKLWPLPVSELFFVGRASFEKLRRLGISTIGDLAHTDIALLKQHLKSHGEVLWHYANGLDDSPVESIPPANKGYGNSTTIPFDICDCETASMVLLSLAETLGMRLRRDQAAAEIVSVGIKSFDLRYASHQKILSAPTNITKEIHEAAYDLFLELWDRHTPIRHLGIHTSRISFQTCHRQLTLFDSSRPDYEKLEKMDAMADSIRSRFGLDTLKRAAFSSSRSLEHAAGGITREKMNVDYTAETL